jgi:4-hydroxythreonine-4-phosphate dehydrogenase
MAETARWLGRDIKLNIVSAPSEASSAEGTIDLMPLSQLGRGAVAPGKPEVAGGGAMVAYITRAVEMIQAGELDAMVTCPISKALMQAVGHLYEGHTQLIADLTRTRDFVMMLAGPKLRVTLATIHCALKDVPDMLTRDMVHTTIRITAESLIRDFGLRAPRLAVAALNPHAGESGIFGSEEADIIEPAVQQAREAGFHVEGPLPADTLFHKAVSGGFDAVVAMYHDQGLIPLKLLHFSDAVNVTLGLPIVRTSVDHGTAYDIAGKGRAGPASLKAAMQTACIMVENRWKLNS